ncbi:MAG: hypothetical protein LBK07_00160 [Tannerella sp.]|nr:hypothetical protein [Tannerella sp.]
MKPGKAESPAGMSGRAFALNDGMRQNTPRPENCGEISIEMKTVSIEMNPVSIEMKTVSIEMNPVSIEMKPVSMEISASIRPEKSFAYALTV